MLDYRKIKVGSIVKVSAPGTGLAGLICRVIGPHEAFGKNLRLEVFREDNTSETYSELISFAYECQINPGVITATITPRGTYTIVLPYQCLEFYEIPIIHRQPKKRSRLRVLNGNSNK